MNYRGKVQFRKDVIVPTAGSCGVAKERMTSQDEDQYCLDWFMCFRREKK